MLFQPGSPLSAPEQQVLHLPHASESTWVDNVHDFGALFLLDVKRFIKGASRQTDMVGLAICAH
jgi:hypothetical protein